MNVENIDQFKAGVAGFLGFLTALWGWTGWLLLVWVLAMLLDWISGTARARKDGSWSSQIARDGAWHKVGEVIAILVSFLLDVAVSVILPNIPGLSVELSWTFLLCPMVAIWYIVTEAGSIVENVGRMGAPVPKWLRKAIASLGEKIDNKADRGPSGNP